jgi:hypothetical protein
MKLITGKLKKIIINILIVLKIQVLCFSINTYGSNQTEHNCLKDSLEVLIKQNDKEVEIQIINLKTDTVYLFSTYFDSIYYASISLHRLSKKEGVYKISFLPLVPYLNVKRSDLLKYNYKDRVRGNEATYEFITLSPKDTSKLIYPLEYLYFDKIVKEFDLKDLKTGYTPNIFEYPNKIKYCKSKGLKKYPLIFEFALYLMFRTPNSIFNN